MIDAGKTRQMPPQGIAMSAEQLAQLGDGSIAYVRLMRSEELQTTFPQIGRIAPGLKLYALLSANGSPIMVTDSHDAAIANAWEHNLQTVSVH